MISFFLFMSFSFLTQANLGFHSLNYVVQHLLFLFQFECFACVRTIFRMRNLVDGRVCMINLDLYFATISKWMMLPL